MTKIWIFCDTSGTFNPDFAVEIVRRVSNASQLGVLGYFLADE